MRSAASTLVGVAIAGPRSRELLQPLVRTDLSAAAFRLFQVMETAVGLAPAILARAGFTGELGYEIWTTPDYFLTLYETAAAMRARAWGWCTSAAARCPRSGSRKATDPSTRTSARTTRPARPASIASSTSRKPDFVGRDAALAERAAGPQRRFVVLEVDAADADVVGYESILKGEEAVGYVTSGAYGHCVGKSLAAGYVPGELASRRRARSRSISSARRAQAWIRLAPLYDPQGLRLRA